MTMPDTEIDATMDLTYAESADDVLEPLQSEIDDAESSPPQYRLATYPADFTLEVLRQKWNNRELVIPQFQRRFVWKITQASKLIESFLHNLPVPPVYFYTEGETGNLLVVDGQQRLKTVFYYFEGYFGEPDHLGRRKIFQLQGISEKSPYFNKSFADLEDAADPSAKRLLNSVLRAFVVQQLDPDDDTSVFHIFERLNTGGTPLTGQEIRNCLMSGPFNDEIGRLNMDQNWRLIFGRSAPDIHMRDQELIIRVFSLLEGLDQYTKPMKEFLSRFMRRNRTTGAQRFASYFDGFRKVSQLVVAELGPKPFHIRAGLNAAVFDAVFVALMTTNDVATGDLERRYRKLIGDTEFIRDTATGTTDVETVRRRIATARTILTG